MTLTCDIPVHLQVLYLIRDRPNVCNQLHLPAQSGSSRMLDLMRRGYTREAYLELVDRVRGIIPGEIVCTFLGKRVFPYRVRLGQTGKCQDVCVKSLPVVPKLRNVL